MSPFDEGTRAYSGPVSSRGPRVLLMVERDGRVVSVWRRPLECEYGRNPSRFASHLETFSHIKPMPYRDLRLAYEAARWWLVEAESADAARKCIDCRPLYGDTGGYPVGVNQHGRILASGGGRQ